VLLAHHVINDCWFHFISGMKKPPFGHAKWRTEMPKYKHRVLRLWFQFSVHLCIIDQPWLTSLPVNRIYIRRYQLRSVNCSHCYRSTLLDVMVYQLPIFLPLPVVRHPSNRLCGSLSSLQHREISEVLSCVVVTVKVLVVLNICTVRAWWWPSYMCQYFIWQLSVATVCRLVYHINVTH